jgi:hypothetical protein
MMTTMTASTIDLSPYVFGLMDDHVTIRARSCEDAWDLLGALDGHGAGDAVVIAWARDAQSSAVEQAVRHLQSRGVRATLLLLPDTEQEHESLTRLVMPTIGPAVLALGSGQRLSLYWPARFSMTPLRQAVQRAVKWRGSWCSLDDFDGVSAPAQLD